MLYTNRKQFLQSGSILVAAALAGFSFDVKRNPLLLSFSSLGCPDWTFKQIVDFAVLHNYTGIELRGILRQLDLTKCPEFNTKQNRADTLKMMDDNGLKFVDLGSSATLHFADAATRLKNIEEAKQFIDLAQDIKCPYVRVFPNLFPKDQEREATMELISTGLLQLGDYARGSNVTVLMETHGDLVYSADIEKVMAAAPHQHVALIWDVANMWSITKENPLDVYQKLKKYIRHTHIKDLKIIAEKMQYTLLGEGEVPIFNAINALIAGGYKGFYSFEWEKLWHPELAKPEIALADYPIKMRTHFSN